MRTKAVWSKQPDDPFVQAEWVEALAPVEYEDANLALTAFRNEGDEAPPTIGQLRVAAFSIAGWRDAELRARRRALEDRTVPDPQQVAEVREMVDSFLKRHRWPR